MPRIFISYRRDDSRKDSGRIYDRMIQAFGKNNVFKDIDDIPFGADFRQVIIEEMSRCDTALVIIGQKWLTIADEHGNRRLDNPADFVRIEVESALARPNIRVIPVLVDNARMPAASELPASLQNLAYRNAAVVRDDPDFHGDVTRLIERLKADSKTTLTGRPKGRKNQSLWMGAGGLVLLVAIIGVILLSGILDSGDDEKDTTQEVTEIVGVMSPTTTETDTPENPTATNTLTVSFTPTSQPTNTPTSTFTPTITPEPTPQAIQLALTGVSSNDEWTSYTEIIDGVEMVLVPAGCFMMGSEDGDDNEKPVHEQCFEEPFWIDRYEVTNAQFRQFDGQAKYSSYWTEDDRPRETIDWFEARDFCEGRGARLPTEKEWEYAARGPDNRVYPWGNDFIPDNVVYDDNADETASVGSRPVGVSWVGALDMSGNVWEWVSTIYGIYDDDKNEFITTFAYSYTEDDGREQNNDDRTNVRVLRGGSFGNSTNNLRAANRVWDYPFNEVNIFGFRCARSF